MKLSVWAKQQGISYQAAWKWWKAGKLPVEAEQMPTGTIIIKERKTVTRFSRSLCPSVQSMIRRRTLMDNLGGFLLSLLLKGEQNLKNC